MLGRYLDCRKLPDIHCLDPIWIADEVAGIHHELGMKGVAAEPLRNSAIRV